MKPADHYVTRLQEINADFRKALSAITEDGVVQTAEVEVGREIVAGYKKKLKLLKKEITLDIKTIRASYKAQVLAARASTSEDKTQRVHELNLRENRALTEYQQASQQMESNLIDADKTQQVFADVLEDIEQLQSEPIVSLEAEDTLTLEERLLPLLTKWQALVDDADHKIQTEYPTKYDASQIAYWQGVKDELRPAAAAARTPGELRAVIGRMLDRLGESHFAVLPQFGDAAGAGNVDTSGSPGFDVRPHDDALLITRIDAGSPAYRAGLRAGDRITAAGAASRVTIPAGASDHVVRTVTENSRQLGFRDFGFEEE